MTNAPAIVIDYTCLARHFSVRDENSRDLLRFALDSNPEVGERLCAALGATFPKMAWSAPSSKVFRRIQALANGEVPAAEAAGNGRGEGEAPECGEALASLRRIMARALAERSFESFLFADASAALRGWHAKGAPLAVFSDRYSPAAMRERLGGAVPEVPVAALHTGDLDYPEYADFFASEGYGGPSWLILDAYAFEACGPALEKGFRIQLLDRHWVTRSYHQKGFGRYIASLAEADRWMTP